MNGSVSSLEESPKILIYVFSVAGIITSLFFTGYGYLNNSWEVLERKSFGDEFQRGIKGSDCYRKINDVAENAVKCLPWETSDKSSKFPAPFDKILPPSFFISSILYYLGTIIIGLQVLWLVYAVAHCCSSSFAKKTEKLKIALFHIGIVTAGLWVVLFLAIFIETRINRLLVEGDFKPEYEISIGFAVLQYFIGLVFFAIAFVCLFNDQVKNTIAKLRKSRQAVPTSEELVPRNA